MRAVGFSGGMGPTAKVPSPILPEYSKKYYRQYYFTGDDNSIRGMAYCLHQTSNGNLHSWKGRPMRHKVHLSQPAVYTIKVQGRLESGWSDWFDHLEIVISKSPSGPSITTLTGRIIDQAALHGLLVHIRDLGLPLLLVQHAGLDLAGKTTRGFRTHPPLAQGDENK
ncbi:MAG: hypothetical protein JW929_08420 [Anaerolineales bacterium]|nr:hypothetical protein [Anaerolineales bacterium]